MINTLISIASPEKINVYRLEEVISDNGSSRIAPILKKGGLTVSVQPSGSLNSVGGQQIVNTIAGKTNKIVYIVYSPRFKFQEKDLIVRDDGIVYEVQHAENNGRGSLLQHDKYYIVKYDNQKVLTAEQKVIKK